MQGFEELTCTSPVSLEQHTTAVVPRATSRTKRAGTPGGKDFFQRVRTTFSKQTQGTTSLEVAFFAHGRCSPFRGWNEGSSRIPQFCFCFCWCTMSFMSGIISLFSFLVKLPRFRRSICSGASFRKGIYIQYIYILYIYIFLNCCSIQFVSVFDSLSDFNFFFPISTLVPVASGAPANVSTLSQCHGLKLRQRMGFCVFLNKDLLKPSQDTTLF